MTQQVLCYNVDSNRYAIGFDIGGTKIAAAVVAGDGRILEQLIAPMPRTTEGSITNDVADTLLKMAGQLGSRWPRIEAVGAGAAGIVQWPDGLIRWAPNSPYEGLPLRKVLEHGIGLPAVVDNDANVAAWAEAVLGGPGERRHDFVFLTIGTGIGGGVLLQGDLYRGPTGVATELGHIVLDPRGPICGCGGRGCLEAFASGLALERRGRQAVRDNPRSRLAQRADSPEAVTGRFLHAAAQEGDPLARSLFEETGYWLGVGIASITNIFEVEAVVIGGGLAEVGDLLLEPARVSAADHAYAPDHRPVPPILPAKFANNAGVIGAAHMAMWRNQGQHAVTTGFVT